MKIAPAATSLLALTLILSSCAVGYKKDWDAAPVGTGDLTGAWEGTWKSTSNGHHGLLRCIVTEVPETSQGSDYHFHYFATWGRIYRDDYKVTYDVADQGGGSYWLAGEADLGRLAGGMYSHEGTASSESISATYSASWDRGFLELRRPVRLP